MRILRSLSIPAILLAGATSLAHATPFGIASAYNIFALGSTGPLGVPGTINATSDVGGRVAASGTILNVPQIGANPIVNDSFGSVAPADFVSPGGYTGQNVKIDSNGNAYAPGASPSLFDFHGTGSLITTGPSPLNFASIRSSIDSQSLLLGGYLGTGSTTLSGNDLLLVGVSPTLNIFNVTAAQLGAATDVISITAPAGSTVLVNVSGGAGGSSPVDVSKLFYNGVQATGDSNADQDILFNFYQAQSSVVLGGQFSASILAPFATIQGGSQIDGSIIAAAFNDTGEIHNVEFTGNLPTPPADPSATPEPSSLALLATGALACVGALRRRTR